MGSFRLALERNGEGLSMRKDPGGGGDGHSSQWDPCDRWTGWEVPSENVMSTGEVKEVTGELREGFGSQPQWSVVILEWREPSQAMEEGGPGVSVLSRDPPPRGPVALG